MLRWLAVVAILAGCADIDLPWDVVRRCETDRGTTLEVCTDLDDEALAESMHANGIPVDTCSGTFVPCSHVCPTGGSPNASNGAWCQSTVVLSSGLYLADLCAGGTFTVDVLEAVLFVDERAAREALEAADLDPDAFDYAPI